MSKKHLRLLSFLFFLQIGHGCITGEEKPEMVSLVRVMASPNLFDGKMILTIGYMISEFENMALYLSKEHANVGDTLSSVALPGSLEDAKKLDPFSRKWVMIVGRFSADRGGVNHNSGSFRSVESIEEWPPTSNQ